MTANLTQAQVSEIIEEACSTARAAAEVALAKYGDRDACGFAWVSIHGVKGNTRLGKMLKLAGVRQSYDRTFQIWNPSGLATQSMGILEEGADAAAKVFRKYGFKAYAGSRMD